MLEEFEVEEKRGFTIVELLIVIVVVAILAMISVVAYNGIQRRANDSVRQQDIQNYRKALAMAKTIDGSLPTGFAYIGSEGGWGSGPFDDAIIDKGYLSKRLLDPVYIEGNNSKGYVYVNRNEDHPYIGGDNDPSTYAIRFFKDNPPSSGSPYFCATSKNIYQAGTQPGTAYGNQCIQE